ncbi:MAG: OsmC family protein [Cryomorphaceae bacterium]|jgi:putative redox protein|nr:OsmC family protein [Cryomorphaceae bacterium]
MKVSLERIDDGFGMLAKAGNHELRLDTAEEFGGKDGGFRPMQLMLISLAGCSAIDIIHILKKGRHEIRSYSSEVVASRREEMPRIFDSVELVITVDTDASDAVLERAVELTKTKYCSAFAVLEASVKVGLKLQRA